MPSVHGLHLHDSGAHILHSHANSQSPVSSIARVISHGIVMENAVFHVTGFSLQDNTVRNVLWSVGSVVVGLGDHRLSQVGLSNNGTTNSANLSDERLRTIVEKDRGNVILATIRTETISLIARRTLASVVALSRKMNASSKFVAVVTEGVRVRKSTTIDLKNVNKSGTTGGLLGLQIASDIGDLELTTLAGNTVQLRRSTHNQRHFVAFLLQTETRLGIGLIDEHGQRVIALKNDVGVGSSGLAVTILILLITILADAVVSTNGIKASGMLVAGVGALGAFVDVFALVVYFSETSITNAIVTAECVSAVAVRGTLVDVFLAFVDVFASDHTITTETLLAFTLVLAVREN